MNELKEYGRKGEMSAGSLEVIDKLTHTIKNLCKIIESAEEEEYSMAGNRNYTRGEGNGMRSYTRGRGRNARRDSIGRYSYGNDEMVGQLEELMQEAPEQIKQDIQRIISKVENM